MKASRPKAGGSKSIEASVKKHIEMTNKYVAEGMSKAIASKKAFTEILKANEE